METSQPWDGLTDGDASRAPYSSTEWDDMYEAIFASLGDSGVFSDYLQALMVEGTSSPLTVKPGTALVKGKWYRNDDRESIPVDSPVGATRRDWIVLRSCWGDVGDCALVGPQAIRVVLKQNPDEDLSPPALTQTDDVCWEIPLALIDTTTLGVITVYDRRVLIPRGEAYEFIPPLSGYNETLTREIPVTPECLPGCGELEPGVLLADGSLCKAFGRYVIPRDASDDYGDPFYPGLHIFPIFVSEGDGTLVTASSFHWGHLGQITEDDSAISIDNPVVLENVLSSIYLGTFPLAEEGAVVKLIFARNGAAGGDTVNEDVLFLGWVVGMIRQPTTIDVVPAPPCPDPTPGLCCTPGGGGVGGEKFFGIADFQAWAGAAAIYQQAEGAWIFYTTTTVGDVATTWRVPSGYLGNKFDIKLYTSPRSTAAGSWTWDVNMYFRAHGQLIPPTAAVPDVVWSQSIPSSTVDDQLIITDIPLDSGDPLTDVDPGDFVFIDIHAARDDGAPDFRLSGMLIEWE